MDRAIARDGNDSQQRISEVDLDRITTGTMRLDASSSLTPEDEPGEFIVLVPNELCSPHPSMKQRLSPCPGSRGIIALKLTLRGSHLGLFSSYIYYLYRVYVNMLYYTTEI